MAKKGDKAAVDEAEREGEAPAAKAGGRGKTLVLAAVVALLAGAAAGGYLYMQKKSAEAEAAKAATRQVAFIELKEMTVNLAQVPNQERQRYLRMKASLEVAEAKTVADIQPLLPRVEDAFQVYVRELRPSDIDGSAGIYRLKEELLRRVNIAVHPARVDAVLFKEIVVQ
ncbi:flagellar basal body-associated protein FliL [Chelatococcus sp. SYSU_G07232]|uniref:Flagellar protein FliL n=1 Tax=Chelatococcus albus TaxID=3047466 RepID=A0ABT7AGF8_9HYPH|nr:flagellar basal body-associated protein FliL [Chelatococcus sp. SYSU_G07232]MDJ1158449.1 flagellar basal body-associated protein FliL [Chelatococcus sp. SYSU_G07232]